MKRLAWSDSRYVRVYCDDHPDWNALTFEAQALYVLLRRRADRAGMLPLGIDGVRDLPGLIGHGALADRLMPFFSELVRKGFLEVGETHAIIPEFIESESALASPASRKRKERETRRDVARLSASSRQDVTPGGHTSVTPRDTAPLSRQDVTLERHARTSHDVTQESRPGVTSERHTDGHTMGHDRTSPSSFHSSSDHIPPNPPTGDSGGEGGRESKPVHDDPNLEDIRRKLLAMPPPLRHLPSVRAEERLYAPVMSGGLTVKHVLQAIDDAAVSLGPDLGDVQLGDRVGLTNLERFVAGCVKRARRERQAMPPAPTQPSQRHSAPVQEYQQPSPEALDALDRFREMYTSTGGYDRYVVGPDDTRLSAEAVAECAKHGDAQDILLRALDAYMRDDFYGSQGHTLKRFVAVLKSEPARLIGRRKHVETEEEKIARGKRKQLMEDLMHLVAP